MSKTALITGVTGQDGSYLSELLLSKGYTVHGLVRRSSSFNTERIDHIYQGPQESGRSYVLHHADLSDGVALVNLLRDIQPDEVYNLGAQSHVRVSFDAPLYTGDVTGLGALRLLEAVRASGIDTRIYQASSSEMFGSTPPPQNEQTPFHPRSPYGAAKVFAYWATVNYREAYDMYAVNGILFNHESPRRGETFVTRKITRAVARIKAGLQSELYLGNLDAVRDWGYAPEYVDAMWRMLQQDEPTDYVVATGVEASVRQFLEAAFGHAGLDWREYVRHDAKYERPSEVDALIGDASKARDRLGWKPEVLVEDLARIMVDADIRQVEDALAGASVRIDR
ncbi:GDP-mannose 4,6-dehydratase [Streptomyces sp. JJ66]|uniref:GDP-mannose 4,6-dehydratase n=1 Tax=Streptomyces sp. JJ66 TaxID=2803843 RepID=UPI001C5943D2|nr:GDP-mannose 4,6-dehydratase [Streptomyces sp. JJ66]MBW1601126.1 GDP-mannose 4,6-dehydratase [Streptomyces sp. JJ66]